MHIIYIYSYKQGRSKNICLPYDFDEFTHIDIVRYKEFGLVKHWQTFLSIISFYDNLS